MADKLTTDYAKDPIAIIVRSLTSASHKKGFQAVVEAVLAGRSGICLTGEQGIGRTAFLDGLAAVLPATHILVARLNATARSPEDLTQLLRQAEECRSVGGRVLLIVQDADVLRRDTLDRLDEIAGDLLTNGQALQLLLVGRPTLLNRLKVNQHRQLEAYVGVKVMLPLLTPPEAAGYLTSQLALLGPANKLSQAQIQAVLQMSDGNPRLIRDALAEQLRAQEAPKPASVRRVLPSWMRQPVAGVATLVLLAGVATGALRLVLWHDAGHSPSPPMSSPAEIKQTTPLDQNVAPDSAVPTSSPNIPPSATEPPHGLVITKHAFAMLAIPSSRLERREESRPGLLLIARRGDTLETLYRRIYRGVSPPSYKEILAANPEPIRPGARVMFPTPPDGWKQGQATEAAPSDTR